MGQEFLIKSKTLEDKINQLLPSQGYQQAGVDLSASTQIIPIVDLTESAEGSNLRVDLQSALSLTGVTAFNVRNTTSTLVATTGYYRVFGNFNSRNTTGGTRSADFKITDGVTTKELTRYELFTADIQAFDFIVFLEAGDSLTATTNNTDTSLTGCTRQLADISGNLINP